MKISIVGVLLLIALGTSMILPHPGKPKVHVPRVYKVQMHAPPRERWEKIIYDYRHALHLFVSEFELLPIPKALFNAMDWYAHHVFIHKDFVQQIDALADLTGYPFGQLFFLNFMYEFSTIKACSTILVRSASGTIYHGRNLDFQFMRVLSQLVTQVDYYDGPNLVYTIDTVVGSVFALTGIRYGAFAVNVDTRYATNSFNNLVSVLLDGAIPDVWLLKRVLQEQTNYHDVVKRLSNTLIGGPVYYMVSGLKGNEACVIERDTNSVHAFYELNATTWFLVQTNYDRDQPDPTIDPRRGAVEIRLAEQGRAGFDQKILFEEFMSQWPSFNLGTIMTAIMIPSTKFHNSTVWWKSNPSGEQSQ